MLGEVGPGMALEDAVIRSAGERRERFKWQLSSTSQVPRSPA